MNRMTFYLRLFLRYLEFWGYTPETCYSRIGIVYYEDGDYRKAISEFLKSEDSHGGRDHALARYNLYFLGRSYWNLGSLREANRCFEKYFQLDKKNHEIACMIAYYYGAISENEAALSWFQHALKLQPRLFPAIVECVRLLLEFGRIEEALRYLDDATAIAQTPVEKQFVESLKNKISDHPCEAITILKNILAQPDTQWSSAQLRREDAASILALFQRELGDTKGALQTLQSAAENKPIDPWLANDLAMEYHDQEIRLEDALSLIEHALRAQPENAIFLDTKGLVLLKLGRNDEGKAVIEKSQMLLPEYHNPKKNRVANFGGTVL